MNFRKFSRLIGSPASHPGPMPLMQLGLDGSYLARHNPFGGSPAGPYTSPGQCAVIAVDPPVGGFAGADIIGQFPNLLSYDTWQAVYTLDASRNFAPGIYCVGLVIDLTTVNTGIMLDFWGVTPAGGIKMLGGSTPPTIGWQRRQGSIPFYQCFELHFDQKWLARVYTPTGMLDANLATIAFTCVPLHLMDDYGSE